MTAVPAIPESSISGRSQPREDTSPYDHDIRLHGLPTGEIRVTCVCTEGTGSTARPWARTFEAGHTPYDFMRLAMQHTTGRYA